MTRSPCFPVIVALAFVGLAGLAVAMAMVVGYVMGMG